MYCNSAMLLRREVLVLLMFDVWLGNVWVLRTGVRCIRFPYVSTLFWFVECRTLGAFVMLRIL